jgi:hypothetical protein
MKLKNSLLLLLLFVLSACDNAKQEQADLQKKVIDSHDILMVQMDEIMNKKLKLDSISANFETIKKEKPATDTAALKLSIDSLKTRLTQADEAMMSWMHQFNPDHTGKSHEEVMNYLKDQQVKIDSVKTLFDHSLSKSELFISKF